MSDPVWYYAHGDTERGPLTTSQIKALAAAGKIQRDDFVWKEGMETWATARDVAELFGAEAKPVEKIAAKTGQPEGSVSSDGDSSPAPWRWAMAVAVTGMLMVVLSRGCDTLGERYATRMQSIAAASPRQFEEQWDQERIRLDRALAALGTSSELQSERESLEQQQGQLDDNMEALKAELSESVWRNQATAAQLARDSHQQWGFWREVVVFAGTLILTLGSLAVGIQGTGPERWISIAMLGVVGASALFGGS